MLPAARPALIRPFLTGLCLIGLGLIGLGLIRLGLIGLDLTGPCLTGLGLIRLAVPVRLLFLATCHTPMLRASGDSARPCRTRSSNGTARRARGRRP